MIFYSPFWRFVLQLKAGIQSLTHAEITLHGPGRSPCRFRVRTIVCFLNLRVSEWRAKESFCWLVSANALHHKSGGRELPCEIFDWPGGFDPRRRFRVGDGAE